MKLRYITAAVAVTAAMSMSNVANATIATFFDNMFTGATSFDSQVTGVGGSLTTDTWANLGSGTLFDRGAYTIERNDGGTMFGQVYTLSGSSPTTTTTGETIGIDPSSTDIESSRAGSAMKLSFVNPVNGIGFEVGDWSTCCQPSNLYISFDGGAPILVGESDIFGDQFLTNGGAGVFVGAIDDSGEFSTVEFWGDGFGEFLVAGGTIRYALVDQGSLPPTGVPEPATLALLGVGLVGLGAIRRRDRR